MARPERRLIFDSLGQPYAIKLANLPAMSIPLPGVYGHDYGTNTTLLGYTNTHTSTHTYTNPDLLCGCNFI